MSEKNEQELGTLERIQRDLQEARTVEEMAIAIRDVGWLVRWLNTLVDGAVRDVLFYEEANTLPGFPLYETELRFKEALAKTPAPVPGRKEPLVRGKLTYEQAQALAATMDTLSAAWWSVVAASKALGATD